MAFLDTLGELAKNLGDKAGDAIELTKLSSKITSEEKAIGEAYKQIGEVYYKKYKDGETLGEDVLPLCTEIDSRNTIIAETRAEIESKKTEQVVAETTADPVTQDEQPATKFCTGCGSPLPAGVAFCSKCGTKS
ncbi:MAG: zinc ribbon domain-containing protein [Clostridiales bacterium]|jgi:hypothetical protein|nr:zinc ribbon domain-containing protein [Clostridiales bacterium]